MKSRFSGCIQYRLKLTIRDKNSFLSGYSQRLHFELSFHPIHPYQRIIPGDSFFGFKPFNMVSGLKLDFHGGIFFYA
jgi:hypothetical protein